MNQQEQQSRLSVQNTQHKSLPSLMDMSSFGMMDDLNTIHSLDSMDLLSTSPPKQTIKAPSIFSPEWNEKSSSVASNNNGNNSLLSGVDHGANGSEMMNAMPSLSPKRDYDKRAISDINVKKEKQKDHSQSHRSSSLSMQSGAEKSSFNLKREPPISSSAGLQYDSNLPQNLLDNKSIKRSYNADLSQTDSTDGYQPREMKLRRTEQLSPIQNVSELAKSATTSKLINGIESKPMESPNSDKYGKLGEYAKGSGNAVPITTDLVSSLIKESLNDTVSKYSTPLDAPQKKIAPLPSAPIKSDHMMPAGYTMSQHSMIESREQNQAHLLKSEEFDRLQATQYGNQQQQQQHSQYRRMQQMSSVPTSRSSSQQMPTSKAISAPSIDDQQYTELQQQPHLLPKPQQFHQEQSHQNMYGTQGLPPQLQIKSDADQRTKSEKKKKKEKHKNKDKEKSKNREERKKHKKDKDRHKDKSSKSSLSGGHEHTSSQDVPKSPILLKLSNVSYNAQTALHNDASANVAHQQQNEIPKLKIARVGAASRSSSGSDIKSQATSQAAGQTTSSLKIKLPIPKVKMDNYSGVGSVGSSSTTAAAAAAAYNNNQHKHSNELNHSQNVGSGSGSASKKKDRTRERDKSMRNTANLPNQTKVIEYKLKMQ